jgi:hypothetical protein
LREVFLEIIRRAFVTRQQKPGITLIRKSEEAKTLRLRTSLITVVDGISTTGSYRKVTVSNSPILQKKSAQIVAAVGRTDSMNEQNILYVQDFVKVRDR